MNRTINERRLDVLAREIDRLEDETVEAERAAGDLAGDELACELVTAAVVEKHAELERALRAYFIESEVVRKAELRRVA